MIKIIEIDGRTRWYDYTPKTESPRSSLCVVMCNTRQIHCPRRSLYLMITLHITVLITLNNVSTPAFIVFAFLRN